jgi:hypothetical protein
MFLNLEIKDMHRSGFPTAKITINSAHIVRIVDESAGPVVHMAVGEPLRLVETYAAVMALLKTNYLVAYKGV